MFVEQQEKEENKIYTTWMIKVNKSRSKERSKCMNEVALKIMQ